MSQSDAYGKIQNLVEKTYGARYRLRVCGVLIKENQILMVRNEGVGEKGILWAPPGGEIEFGERLHQGLEREVLEETGILGKTKRFLFLTEFLKNPFHAIELFFEMEPVSGKLSKGSDPELGNQGMGIGEVKWMEFDELNKIPSEKKHRIFREAKNPEDLLALKGFVQILNP